MPGLSREAQVHMQAVTKGLPTKSAKIRALAASGYKRQEIADFLSIRYQHVRNVLLQPLAQRGSLVPSHGVAGFEEGPSAAHETADERVEASGNLPIEGDGRVLLPAAMRNVFGWQPGRRIFWLRERDTVRLFSEEAALRFAQALVSKHAISAGKVVDEFLRERRDEARREDRG